MLKILHLPNNIEQALSYVFEFIKAICMMILSFLVILLPLKLFFPFSISPDFSAIILFSLLLHRFALYLIPIFFILVAMYEFSFFMPVASLFLHYGIFMLFGYFSWQKRLSNDISIWLVYFYFYVTYAITLIIDVFIYSLFYKGYLGFDDAFCLWLNTVLFFPFVFYFLYYFLLQGKPYHCIDRDL